MANPMARKTRSKASKTHPAIKSVTFVPGKSGVAPPAAAAKPNGSRKVAPATPAPNAATTAARVKSANAAKPKAKGKPVKAAAKPKARPAAKPKAKVAPPAPSEARNVVLRAYTLVVEAIARLHKAQPDKAVKAKLAECHDIVIRGGRLPIALIGPRK